MVFTGFVGGDTDADGRYRFDGVELAPGNRPNTSTVITDKADSQTKYWSERQSATVTAGETTTVATALVPVCTGSADVRLIDRTTRRPIEGADVWVQYPNYSGNGYDTASATTDRNGRALLPEIGLAYRNGAMRSSLNVHLTINGHSINDATPMELTRCGDRFVGDFEIVAPADRVSTVEGRITDADTGQPIAGVNVAVSGVPGSSGITDADGRYRLADLHWGVDGPTSRQFFVVVTPPYEWLAGPSVPVTLVDGQTAVKDLTLPARLFSDIHVQVVDIATGDPLPGATVYLNSETRESDADGWVRFDHMGTNNVPFVAYTQAFLRPTFLDGSTSIRVVPGELTTGVVALDRVCAARRPSAGW